MISKDDARKEVKKLIDKYEDYKQKGELEKLFGKGKEQNAKATFIEPLFEALGWNTRDPSEFDRESSIIKGRVDYGVSLDKQYKFFIEAKPLGALDLKKDTKQAIGYGVNSGHNWVILTNFETLIVFNCEWGEKEWWKNTLFHIELKDYTDKFDLLWILSKESIRNHSLEDYSKTVGKRIPRTPIDKDLLEKFLKWRQKLSSDISKGGNYSPEDIDEFVQKFLVRLLFIRNCEDREFETEYKLLPVVKVYRERKAGLLKFLRKVFDYYDSVYNSGIFEVGEIDKIKFNEDMLADIIEGLDETNDGYKYDFKLIPADVMGNLYEQYLGHILKKTKIKDGSAHRKEQGIYYTPSYIVDYIVKNTVGELLKDKKVKLEKIRILDPACGSGSFLIKAFQAMDENYKSKDKKYEQTKLDSTGLMYSKKVEILQNNIFGVDLDKQAIELARLNILLQIAEKGEKLPIIKKNIQCGNSLIDDPAVAGEDKAFKWEERFKDVMDEGGFDVVIGNPPYLLMQPQNTDEKTLNYLKAKFKVAQYKIDIYHLFLEKSIRLLKEGAYLGFITPNTYLMNIHTSNLRKLILDNCRITQIVIIPKEVFSDASVDTAIIVLQKENTERIRSKSIVDIKQITESNMIQPIKQIEQAIFCTNKDYVFNPNLDKSSNKLFEKFETKEFIKLGEIAHPYFGIQTFDRKKYVSPTKLNNEYKPVVDGQDIKRYSLSERREYVKFSEDAIKSGGKQEVYENDKIFIRQIGKKPIAAYGPSGVYSLNTLYNLFIKNKGFSLKFLLGILNSKVVAYFWKMNFSDSKELFPKIKRAYIEAIPIPITIFAQQTPLIDLVDKMLSLNKRLKELGDKKTDERTRIEEDIKKTDAEIDELVYKLYGITDSEKKIIEESLK